MEIVNVLFNCSVRDSFGEKQEVAAKLQERDKLKGCSRESLKGVGNLHLERWFRRNTWEYIGGALN